MGRKPKIRVTYQNDASFLLRLAEAVNRDPTKSNEWKDEVRALLHRIASMFLTDTADKIVEG